MNTEERGNIKGTFAVEVGGDLNIELLLKTLNHGDLPEGRGEVDFELLTLRTLGVVLDLVRAGDVVDQA